MRWEGSFCFSDGVAVVGNVYRVVIVVKEAETKQRVCVCLCLMLVVVQREEEHVAKVYEDFVKDFGEDDGGRVGGPGSKNVGIGQSRKRAKREEAKNVFGFDDQDASDASDEGGTPMAGARPQSASRGKPRQIDKLLENLKRSACPGRVSLWKCDLMLWIHLQGTSPARI